MDSPQSDALDLARRAADLTHSELWLRYFALGGKADALHVEAVVVGLVQTTSPDLDRIVHVLNERFTELGKHHRMPYSDDDSAEESSPVLASSSRLDRSPETREVFVASR